MALVLGNLRLTQKGVEQGCGSAGTSCFRVVLHFLTFSPIEIKSDGWFGQMRGGELEGGERKMIERGKWDGD